MDPKNSMFWKAGVFLPTIRRRAEGLLEASLGGNMAQQRS